MAATSTAPQPMPPLSAVPAASPIAKHGPVTRAADWASWVMDALLGMLAPDVVFHGDGGGKAQVIGKPLAGRQRVMRLLVGLFRRGRVLGTSLRLAWVNGQPGAVMYDVEGRVVSVVELDVADGVVQAIRAVVNPDKLWSYRTGV